MKPSELIGLDVGQKRTGIARGSSVAKIAEPLKSVQTDKVVAELREMAQNSQLEAVIIGLPRNLNGDDTAQTKWVRQWAANAKKELNIPMFWTDEALTSKNTGEDSDEHARAAATILQDFLDTPPAERLQI